MEWEEIKMREKRDSAVHKRPYPPLSLGFGNQRTSPADRRFGEPSLRGREALMDHIHIHWAVPRDG